NGGVPSRSAFTMASLAPAFLAPWGNHGATNLYFAPWGGLNDLIGGSNAVETFSNMDYMLWLGHQSNCTTIGFTITASESFNPDNIMHNEWRKFNSLMLASTNADYIVPLDECIPEPGDPSFYQGDPHHYRFYEPMAL